VNVRAGLYAFERVGLRDAGAVLALVVLYVGVSAVATLWFTRTGFGGFDPATGLVVPFAVAFGAVGIAAAGLSVVATDLLSGAVGVSTAVVALAHLLGGLLAFRLGRRLTPTAAVTTVRGGARWLAGFFILAVTVSAAVAAFVGWGNELFGIAPFYLASDVAVGYALWTTVLGLPLLVLFERVGGGRVTGRESGRGDGVPGAAERPSGARYFVPLVVVLSLGWLALGIVGSTAFRIVETLPASTLHGAGLGFAVSLVDSGLFGSGAVHALTAIAVLALTLLVVLLVADRRAEVMECG